MVGFTLRQHRINKDMSAAPERTKTIPHGSPFSLHPPSSRPLVRSEPSHCHSPFVATIGHHHSYTQPSCIRITRPLTHFPLSNPPSPPKKKKQNKTKQKAIEQNKCKEIYMGRNRGRNGH